MFFYILSLYIFTYQERLNHISNILAVLLIALILINIIKKKKIVINSFLILYFIFIIFGLFSVLYAIDSNTSISKVRTLMMLFLLMFSFINYIDTLEKIHKFMKYFAYSGFITSIYIFLISDFTNLTRFGSELGNVNAIGMILGISATFSFYFIIEKKEYKYALMFLLNSIIIFMTGSRKSLVFLIFTLIVLVLSKRKKKIGNRIKVALIIALIVTLIVYIVFNVPFFYQIIGRRMEKLFNFVIGKETSDGSINLRFLMIELGWEWFKERPFTGYGINNYRFLLGQTINWITYSHNNIIELLVGIGVIGTAIYYISQIIVINKLNKVSKFISKPLAFSFIAIILGYVFMSVALIYYDSKQFCIVLAVGSIISRLYKRDFEISSNNYNEKRS